MKIELSPLFIPMVFMVLGIFMSIVGFWAIDISISAQVVGAMLTNGFWIRDPVQGYHMGLWLAMLGMFVLAVSAVMSAMIKRRELNESL